MSSNSSNTVRSKSSWSSRAVLCVAAFVVTWLLVNGAVLRQADTPAGSQAMASTRARATVCQQFSPDGGAGLNLPGEADLAQRIVDPGNLRRALSGDQFNEMSTDLIDRVRQNLQVSLDQGTLPGSLEVSIGYVDDDPSRAVRVVNALARQYGSDQNEELAATARKSCREASAAAQAAGREFFEAKSRFYQFLEHHFGEHGDRAGRTRVNLTRQTSYSPEPSVAQAETRPGMIEDPTWVKKGSGTFVRSTLRSVPAKVPDPFLTHVENPDWTELSRRLSDLVGQRGKSLLNKTPLHPEVRAIDNKILDLRKELQRVPRYMADPNPVAPSFEPPPADPPLQPLEPPPRLPQATIQDHETAIRDFQMHKAAMDSAAEAYERLSLEERQTWQIQYPVSAIELRLASVGEEVRVGGRSSGLPLVALTAALAMAAGVGLISSGVGYDPTLDTADQVRAKLPIPVVGIIPAVNQAAATAGRQRSRPFGSLGLIGYGMLLVFICLMILLTAFV